MCWFLLYKGVNQLHVYIYPLPHGPPSLPPRPPSHRSRSLQSTELSLPLVSAVDMVVCLCQSWSPNPSSPPLPALCPHVHSLRLHLYSCLQTGSSVPFF